MDSDESIEYESKSLESGTAEGSVDVPKSRIPVELANGKVWQSSSEPRDCDFYCY